MRLCLLTIVSSRIELGGLTLPLGVGRAARHYLFHLQEVIASVAGLDLRFQSWWIFTTTGDRVQIGGK